jgi:predicted chitinase
MSLIQHIIDWLVAIFTEDPAITDPQPAPKLPDPNKVYDGGNLPTAVVTAPRYPVGGKKLARAVQHIHGGLNPIQIKRLKIILHTLRKFDITDHRHIAYVVQTAWHESDGLMDMTEDRARLGRQPALYAAQNRYWGTGYWGRGFIQVTWKSNYQKLGKLLGLDLVRNPDHLLDEHVAAEALVLGMELGLYTTRKLNDYFNDHRTDWVNARRIVNGLDCAKQIGEDALTIYTEIMKDNETDYESQ